MSEDRLAVLEGRVAALERELAVLRASVGPSPRERLVPADPDNPLRGHPLLDRTPPPEVLAAWQAHAQKELGDLEPITAEQLRQILIDNGWDPTSNEASREIIAAREE